MTADWWFIFLFIPQYSTKEDKYEEEIRVLTDKLKEVRFRFTISKLHCSITVSIFQMKALFIHNAEQIQKWFSGVYGLHLLWNPDMDSSLLSHNLPCFLPTMVRIRFLTNQVAVSPVFEPIRSTAVKIRHNTSLSRVVLVNLLWACALLSSDEHNASHLVPLNSTLLYVIHSYDIGTLKASC